MRRSVVAWAGIGTALLGLGALLPHAASSAPSPLEVLRSGASDRGFARADTVRAFEFPRDHGPHPAFRHEWWYFTGHLRAQDGERFGFELTFFRVALAPPRADTGEAAAVEPAAGGSAAGGSAVGKSSARQPAAGSSASRWRARQIYVAHFAVTDIGRRTFHSTQRFARDALGLSGAQASPLRVWLGGWSVAAPSAAGAMHEASGTVAPSTPESGWTLQAGDCAYRLDLQLHPLMPPVLNGDRGLSVKSAEPGSASYYYSIPRLAATGRIVRGSCGASGTQETGTPDALEVSGKAWLDREWGSGSLGPRQVGWDWFALQLTDGSTLMFYALRDAGGTRDPHSAGMWVDAGGAAHPLTSRDVHLDVLDHWTSPHGTRYPSRWRVHVASIGLDVSAVPVLADQELETTPRYWEGDVDVAGTRSGKAISGEGYVELVGYAGR